MEVIEGLLEDLDRSTQVSGNDHSTTTSHIAIFRIGENRILLNSQLPPMIANGDLVKVAGLNKPGQFSAVACRNMTTGWVTTYNKQGCAVFALLSITLITLLLTLLFYPFILVTVVFAFLSSKVLTRNNTLKKAHQLVNS